MAVIRPEWAIADPLASGPDAYAPPDRRAPKTRRVAPVSRSCAAKLATGVKPVRVPPETWMR